MRFIFQGTWLLLSLLIFSRQTQSFLHTYQNDRIIEKSSRSSSSSSSSLKLLSTRIHESRSSDTSTLLLNKLYQSKQPDQVQIEEEKDDEKSRPLFPHANANPDQLSPTSLAYIGDVVFELFIRSRYVWPDRRTTDLQNKVVSVVRAETQSKLLSELMNKYNKDDDENDKKSSFTSRELFVLNRGRNSLGAGSRKKNKGPKRLSSGSNGSGKSTASIYQDATALETLLGYLYIKDSQRCFEILDWIKNELDIMDQNII